MNAADEGVSIAGRRIGRDQPPFIIAELSGNHNGSLERALQIVEAAAHSGAHALKLQTYTPDTMTLDLDAGEFRIDDPASPWNGRSLYELYGTAHTPWEWHRPIFDRARALGMLCFSTPFDDTAVEFLGVPAYKSASFENTDLPLIRRVAGTGKPMIISTGMASIAELGEAVDAARRAGCKDLILLKCTSSYPASPENTHLNTIPHMRGLFGCEVGLSDHTMGVGAAVAAVALGASVIEKHFTLRRSDGGVDSAFSDGAATAEAVDAAETADSTGADIRMVAPCAPPPFTDSRSAAPSTPRPTARRIVHGPRTFPPRRSPPGDGSVVTSSVQ